MPKTPDEIKKGLECCRNVWVDDHWKNCDSACPYQAEQSYCKNALHHDALALIQQKEKENAVLVADNGKFLIEVALLQAKVKQLEAERDTAITALKNGDVCEACKHYGTRVDTEPCAWCSSLHSNFEWRGVQKEG